MLVFATEDYWITYLAPIAVVLAGRDCQIDFLMLPRQPQPELPRRLRYTNWSRWFRAPRHERLQAFNLLDVPPGPVPPEFDAALDANAVFSTCYLNCKEEIDLDGNSKDRAMYELRRERGRDFLGRLCRFFVGRRYDSALIANGSLFEHGLFLEYAQRTALPCVSVDSFEADDCVVASRNHPCSDWVTDDIWAADEPHVLTPERDERVRQRIAYRDDPDLQSDRWHRLQVVKPASAEDLRQALRLDPARPLALLCANLAWDSAVLDHGRAFRTMKEWYLQIIRWFAERPAWQLVVRTHPIEAKLDQPMSVSDYVTEAFPTLPANVRLVRPTDKISTYGLMKMAALGLVYTSTVGLEMAVRGLPVVVAGRVHYAGKGFTWSPEDAHAFFALLEQAVGGERLQLSARQVELARCYFDAYFERFPKRMPWRWSHLQDDMARLPIARIVAGDCPDEFLKTFDYLAGRTG